MRHRATTVLAALLFKTAALALELLAPRALRAGIDRTTATTLMRSATVRFDTEGWAEDAARSLRDEGFCVVRAGGAQISDRVLERCRTAASARLSDLLARVGRRGVVEAATCHGAEGGGLRSGVEREPLWPLAVC